MAGTQEHDWGKEMTPGAMPKGATDTHFHLFGPASRFQPRPEAASRPPPDALPETAACHFGEMGIRRAVAVQPSIYGLDNSCQMEQSKLIGIDIRLVIVARRGSDRQLAIDHAAGVRGLRFVLAHPGSIGVDELEKSADMAAEMGWHIDLFATPEQIAELEPRLKRLRCPLVIAHFGLTNPVAAGGDDGSRAMLRLLKGGNSWVKMSAPYRGASLRPPYVEMQPLVDRLIAANPDHLLWATDWPHASYDGHKPTARELTTAFSGWVRDERMRHRILVDNPAALYGF